MNPVNWGAAMAHAVVAAVSAFLTEWGLHQQLQTAITQAIIAAVGALKAFTAVPAAFISMVVHILVPSAAAFLSSWYVLAPHSLSVALVAAITTALNVWKAYSASPASATSTVSAAPNPTRA